MINEMGSRHKETKFLMENSIIWNENLTVTMDDERVRSITNVLVERAIKVAMATVNKKADSNVKTIVKILYEIVGWKGKDMIYSKDTQRFLKVSLKCQNQVPKKKNAKS